MRNSNISVPFEEDKLEALKLFARKKEIDIETELSDAIQKLYEKHVPKDARELVEMMSSKDSPATSKPAKKPVAAKPTPLKNSSDNDASAKNSNPAVSTSHAESGNGMSK